jgi:hypothetical protein
MFDRANRHNSLVFYPSSITHAPTSPNKTQKQASKKKTKKKKPATGVSKEQMNAHPHNRARLKVSQRLN